MRKPKSSPRLTRLLAVRVVGMVTVAVGAAAVSAAGLQTTQSPTARAYLEPAEVELGEQFRVVVEVTGATEVGDLRPLFLWWFAESPPDRAVPFVTEIKAPPSEEFGGSVAFSYSLVANRAGSFVVGPFEVTADGQKLRTEPVTLLVTVPDPGAVSVRARLDRTEVQVMEEFELIVDVTPADLRLAWPDLPDFSDFAYRGSMSDRMDGSIVFNLVAAAPGTHEIGPVVFKVGDETFETEPVTLVVTGDAPAIEAHASINTEQTWVGSDFVLVVEIPGVSELDDDPVLPDMSAFAEPPRARGEGSSSDGGRPTLGRTYHIRAAAAGEFEIGPVQVMVAGQTVLTEPVRLVVSEASPPAPVESPKDLRVTATADQRRVYVGQPVIVTYRVLARDNRRGLEGWWVEGDDTLALPLHEGFQVRRLSSGGGLERISVDGRLYRAALVHRTAFFPLEAGQTTIASAVLSFQIHQRDRRFFEMSRAEREGTFTPMSLTTDSIPIEVIPLPAEGRPESFRGHVGRLDVISRVDRTDMEVGDTSTLRVEISHEGYSPATPEPEIAFPAGFEVIEPELDDTRGRGDGLSATRVYHSATRVYLYRLVATREGSFRIPHVEVSWFDPELESYGTSSTQPFDLTVVGVARDGGG